MNSRRAAAPTVARNRTGAAFSGPPYRQSSKTGTSRFDLDGTGIMIDVNTIRRRIETGLNAWTFGEDRIRRRESAPAKRVWSLTIAAGIAACVCLWQMSGDPPYTLVALLAGTAAMAIDFAVEYAGISKRRWDYPGAGILLRSVPLEVPLLFLFCGILATFVTYVFSEQPLDILADPPSFAGLDLVQIALLIMAAYFAVQYALGKIKTLVFWALPLGVAMYISFPEPWLLAISILPVYIDYYLEKQLVKSSDIAYRGYEEDVAINVAISYFPTTLLILGIVAVLLQVLGR